MQAEFDPFHVRLDPSGGKITPIMVGLSILYVARIIV